MALRGLKFAGARAALVDSIESEANGRTLGMILGAVQSFGPADSELIEKLEAQANAAIEASKRQKIRETVEALQAFGHN